MDILRKKIEINNKDPIDRNSCAVCSCIIADNNKELKSFNNIEIISE